MAQPAYKTQPEADGDERERPRPRVLSVQTTSSNNRTAANDNYRRRIAAANDNALQQPPLQQNRQQPEAFKKTVPDTRSRIRAIQGAARTATSVPSITGAVVKIKNVAKAVQVSWMIGAILLPFYPLQLIFGLLQAGGVGAELVGEEFLWGIGSGFVPGEWIFATGFFATLIFALINMFVAVIIYTIRGVKWWRGYGILWFIVITVAYFIPIVNIFPWIVVWMLRVIYAQK